MNKQSETVHIIACGVLAVDLKEVVRRVAPSVQMHFLPGGLHKSPVKLRKRLQETIDSVSALDDVSRIVIGYGVCGRGSVGIRARAVPLVIPRVHDCIALFLGSDARYREQFAKAPGTYYISAGWVEETSDEGSLFTLGSDGDVECGNAGFRHLTQSYGAENAEHIRDFLESWKRNYTRAAFIDSGVGEKKQRYRELAQRMAQDCGWHYEQLDGSHDLLAKALTATKTTDEILVVPPDAITEYDAIHRRLEAVLVSDGVSSPQGTESAPATPDEMTGSERRGMGLGIDAGGTYTDAVLFDFDSDRVLAKAKALTTPWDYTLGIREALAKLDADMLPRVRMTGVSTTLATNAIVEGRGQKTGLLVMPPYGWRENLGFQHKELEFIDGRLEIDGTELQPVDRVQVRRIIRRMVDVEDVAAFAVGGALAVVGAIATVGQQRDLSSRMARKRSVAVSLQVAPTHLWLTLNF